jgi:tetratricopeptide (TPR) repeat protein
MNLRAILLCGALSAATLPAADTLTEQFQRALFEEEANRNLPAAIAGYEAVIKRLDEQRQLAATAVFRLGESYRKLGKTNEAVSAYERIIREFADQETLVKLSGQNLGVLRPRQIPVAFQERMRQMNQLSGGQASDSDGESELRRLEILLETVRSLESMSEEELRTLSEFAGDDEVAGYMKVMGRARRGLESTNGLLRERPGDDRLQRHVKQMESEIESSELFMRQWRDTALRMLEARVEAARRLTGRGDAVTGAGGGLQTGGQDASMLALRVEYERLKESLDRVNQTRSREELRALVQVLLPDATLARLDEMAVAARVELVGILSEYGPEYGPAKAARAKLDEINKSVDERMGAVVQAAQFKLKSLEQVIAAQAGSTSRLTSATDPATRARQKELLEQEIALVEGQFKEVRQKVDAGLVPRSESIGKERELLNLRRKVAMLDESPEAIKRQRELVDQELALVRQLIDISKRQIENGMGSRNDLVELERQMLQLMREDLDLAARPSQNTADRSR